MATRMTPNLDCGPRRHVGFRPIGGTSQLSGSDGVRLRPIGGINQIAGSSTWYQAKCGCSSLRLNHRPNIGIWVAAVFGAVCLMDCRMHVVVRLLEGDVPFNPASLNPTLMPLQRPPEPDCR